MSGEARIRRPIPLFLLLLLLQLLPASSSREAADRQPSMSQTSERTDERTSEWRRSGGFHLPPLSPLFTRQTSFVLPRSLIRAQLQLDCFFFFWPPTMESFSLFLVECHFGVGGAFLTAHRAPQANLSANQQRARESEREATKAKRVIITLAACSAPTRPIKVIVGAASFNGSLARNLHTPARAASGRSFASPSSRRAHAQLISTRLSDSASFLPSFLFACLLAADSTSGLVA